MKNLFFFLLLGCSTTIRGQEIYFPPTTGTTWETTPPSTFGYCPEKIQALYTFLEENQSKAFLLLKDGKIVLEQYFDGFQATDNWYWASAGKTITAFTVGIAQQEGLLSIQDTTSTYLGEGWTTTPAEKEEKITIKNQLSMTTGLDYTVANSNCTDPSCLTYLADAGEQWYYHNAPYTLLDNVIEAATNTTLNQYFSQKVRIPIGMNGAFFQVEDNNVYFSTPRSMARFGLLMLNQGSWGSTPIMTDTAYYNEMINTSQDLNLSYGYLWWLNGKSSHKLPGSTFTFPGFLIPNAPSDTYLAAGKNGQFLSITPSEGLVWIRMGESPDDLPVPFLLNNLIWDKINDLICPLSTADAEKQKWTISPNPVSEVLTIHSPENQLYTWEMYSHSMQLLSKGKHTDTPVFSSYAKGLYWIKIQTEETVAWKKVLKE
jgi:CubicO group peptidase (beta-lactamase class C family)